MPRATRTGATNAGSAVANRHDVVEAAAVSRRRAATIHPEGYITGRDEILDELAQAIAYAEAGDVDMADWVLRHVVHAGASPVVVAGLLADLGALRS